MNRYLYLPDVEVLPVDDELGEPWDVDKAKAELRRWCFACYNTGWVDGLTNSRPCPFCEDHSMDDAV